MPKSDRSTNARFSGKVCLRYGEEIFSKNDVHLSTSVISVISIRYPAHINTIHIILYSLDASLRPLGGFIADALVSHDSVDFGNSCLAAFPPTSLRGFPLLFAFCWLERALRRFLLHIQRSLVSGRYSVQAGPVCNRTHRNCS